MDLTWLTPAALQSVQLWVNANDAIFALQNSTLSLVQWDSTIDPINLAPFPLSYKVWLSLCKWRENSNDLQRQRQEDPPLAHHDERIELSTDLVANDVQYFCQAMRCLIATL
jgi:hypothetical protein